MIIIPISNTNLKIRRGSRRRKAECTEKQSEADRKNAGFTAAQDERTRCKKRRLKAPAHVGKYDREEEF